MAKKNSIDAEEFFDQDHHTDTTSSTTAASDVVDGLVGSAGGGGHSDVKSNSRTLSSSISNSASTSSARSGSLSEDHIGSRQPRMNVNKQLSSSAASTSHGSRDNLMSGSASSNLGGASVQSQPQIQQQQQQPPMSQSMPTTILNIEENRVTIQVPGVQSSNVQPRTSQHPTVVKQSSAEKGIFSWIQFLNIRQNDFDFYLDRYVCTYYIYYLFYVFYRGWLRTKFYGNLGKWRKEKISL